MKRETAARQLAWILVILAFASLASLQSIYDIASQDYRKEQKKKAISFSEPLVPNLETLKLLSLGSRHTLADILWLQTIQYFGSGNPYGKYKALGPMLDRITQLDPRYEYPYQFGVVVLPFMDNVQMALTLGERAQKELPGSGLLTYYHASNYLLYVKDYKKAAYFYDKAAKEKGAPAAARNLAATALNKINDNISDRLIARDYWRTVRENAKTEDEAERAANWEAHMQLVYELELKIQAYKNTFGQYPQSFADLQKSGFIQEIPQSPIDRKMEINPKTGRLEFDKIKE